MNLRKRLSLGQRMRRDKLTDIRELIEVEQRQWGPRMRHIATLGEPMAGLGFTGVVVPNNEPTVAPASVSSQAEIPLYTINSSGTSTYMWIPAGNLRAPQSLRVWAGGTMTTAATTSTLLWTTRVGSATSAVGSASNVVMGSTGVMAPGSVNAGGIAGAAVTAAPWWYEAHLGIRTPGTAGTAIGFFNVELPCQAPVANTLTGMGGGFQFSFDMTGGTAWSIGITSSASATTGAQLQHMTIIAWD